MSKVLFLRRGYGISQEVMANILKTSRKSVREKELGRKEFTRSEMIEITNLFKKYNSNHTVEEIFFE